MATLSHIPNPVSIAVRTAGYTIPANRYARASVNVHVGGTFTINGTTALSSFANTWSVLASSPIQTILFGGGFGFSHIATGQASSQPSNGAAFSSNTARSENSVTGEYYLPTGTVINGTGTWRAVVEEYRS